jgi:hypothetical protein
MGRMIIRWKPRALHRYYRIYLEGKEILANLS